MSVVLGLTCAAPQGLFPQETYEHQLARNNFIQEYNRLAALAAEAPDIHIIMGSTLKNHHHQQLAHNTIVPQQPAAPVLPQNTGFNRFTFSANLGGNDQFVPTAQTFPAAGHLAGHLAGHQAGVQQVPSTHRFTSEPHPGKWMGELADTVPAGVNGLPRQVTPTPEVQAARNAHFQALQSAFQAAQAASARSAQPAF